MCVNGTVLLCHLVKSVTKLILAIISLARSLSVLLNIALFAPFTLFIYCFPNSKTKKSKTKQKKTKGKKEEHVITGFVSTAAQYSDHPHQMIERDCMHAGKCERER